MAKPAQFLAYLVDYGCFIHPCLDGVKLSQHLSIILAPMVFAHTEGTMQGSKIYF